MLEPLVKITELFKVNHISYCLIGGLATLLHHGRANTVDMDFYVLVQSLKTVKSLFEKQGFTVQNLGDDQLRAKIGSVPLDILLADAYVGVTVVKRSAPKKLGKNTVQVATPEDLIILKTLADRSIDRRDVEELRELFGESLDEKYIEKTLKKVRKLLS